MAATRFVNVDEDGNIISPQVLARLIEKLGAGSPLGITADMTLDQIAALGTQAANQEGA